MMLRLNKRTLKICAKFAFAYIVSVYLGMTIALLAVAGIFAPIFALLLFVYVPLAPMNIPGALICLPIPAFISIIVSGKIYSHRFNGPYDGRNLFVVVGGVVGGLTTCPVIFYLIYEVVFKEQEVPAFSRVNLWLCCIGVSGIPAGMVLGRLMASSVVELFRPSPRSAP